MSPYADPLDLASAVHDASLALTVDEITRYVEKGQFVAIWQADQDPAVLYEQDSTRVLAAGSIPDEPYYSGVWVVCRKNSSGGWTCVETNCSESIGQKLIDAFLSSS